MNNAAKKYEDIAVVIPAYNEENTIKQVSKDVLAFVSHVIVIDDGSSDKTAEQVSKLPVNLLNNEGNKGKAFSLWRGMQFAVDQGASAVITLDGDGQHNAEDIPRLVQCWHDNHNHIIIAARIKNRHNAPPLRRFANSFADFWVSWASGYKVRDSQSGFRLYPLILIQQIDPDVSTNHSFVFESEILIDAARLNIKSISIPVDTIYHHAARKSHYRPASDTKLIVKMIAGKLFHRGMRLPDLFKQLISSRQNENKQEQKKQ